MDGEGILGIVIMTAVSLGCAIAFYGIGIYARGKQGPMHFYSGTSVDPDSISDIPAYNRANGRMWKWYSVPYWISALGALFSIILPEIMYISIISLFGAGSIGIGWLVLRYKRICNTYMIR